MRRRMVLATYPDAHPRMGWRLASSSIPIRSCSRRGLPCPLPYGRGGGLLLHRFTIACAHSLTAKALSADYSLWRYPLKW